MYACNLITIIIIYLNVTYQGVIYLGSFLPIVHEDQKAVTVNKKTGTTKDW